MKFGLNLVGVSPRHYPEFSQRAEAAGFESVWLPEHLVLPTEIPNTYLYTADGRAPMARKAPLYDPIVLLATIAATTTTIKLGTNVYILPLRHPVITARSVLTLDRVSRGRAVLGIGVGWLATEFEAVGEDFRTRGRRTDEIVPLLRRFWSEAEIDHQGEHYRVGPVSFEPKPFAQPSIPIEVGGSSPAALHRAGTLGDGWIELGAKNPEQFRAMATTVLAARAEAGRTGPFEITSTQPASLPVIAAHADLGVTRTLLNLVDSSQGPSRSSKDEVLATIERLGEDIVQKF